MEQIEKMTVKEAAEIMGVTPRFIQAGLQQQKLPFGTAVEFDRWSYWISKDMSYKYLKGGCIND